MLGGIGSVMVSPFDETTGGCQVFLEAVLEVDRSNSTATVGCWVGGRVVEVAASLLLLR